MLVFKKKCRIHSSSSTLIRSANCLVMGPESRTKHSGGIMIGVIIIL